MREHDERDERGAERAGSAVHRAVELDADADEVWSAITEPDHLAAWFGADVDVELRPGGRLVALPLVAGTGTRRCGVVTEVELGRRLVFRWWPVADEGLPVPTGPASVVELDVESTGGGTRLTVSEVRAPSALAALSGRGPGGGAIAARGVLGRDDAVAASPSRA